MQDLGYRPRLGDVELLIDLLCTSVADPGCSYKFHKIVHYFSFEVLKKKIWANFQRIIELFVKKIVTMLSKVWIWDPGSEKTFSVGDVNQ